MFCMRHTEAGVHVSDRLVGNTDHNVAKAICQGLVDSGVS